MQKFLLGPSASSPAFALSSSAMRARTPRSRGIVQANSLRQGISEGIFQKVGRVFRVMQKFFLGPRASSPAFVSFAFGDAGGWPDQVGPQAPAVPGTCTDKFPAAGNF